MKAFNALLGIIFPFFNSNYLNGDFQYLISYVYRGNRGKNPSELKSNCSTTSDELIERGAIYLFFIFRYITFVKCLQIGGSRNKRKTSVSSLLFPFCVLKNTPLSQLNGKVQGFLYHSGWVSWVKSLGMSHWGQTEDACCHRLSDLSTMSFMK